MNDNMMGAVRQGGSRLAWKEAMTISTTDVQIDQAELQKRLAAYTRSEDLQRDIADLAQDYRRQGLPVPPAEQLRGEAVSDARKCLEAVMACEAKGHLWKERADPENGTSELSCRCCGRTEHLRC